MSKALPYFKWYPSDAESDEMYASMSDMELGFFHRLLNKSWTNDGLPPDLNDLSVLMKVRRSYLDKVWPRVGKCFTLTATVHPRLVNRRQEEEREGALSKSLKAKTAVGIREKLRNERSSSDGSKDDLRAYGSVSSSGVVVLSSKQNSRAETQSMTFEATRSEAWLWLTEDYPGEVNPDWDCQMFMSVIQGFEDIADLKRNLPLWKVSPKWAEGFVEKLENFLRKRMFKNPPKAREPTLRGASVQDKVKALAMERIARDGHL